MAELRAGTATPEIQGITARCLERMARDVTECKRIEPALYELVHRLAERWANAVGGDSDELLKEVMDEITAEGRRGGETVQ